jgi:hypothetical protein
MRRCLRLNPPQPVTQRHRFPAGEKQIQILNGVNAFLSSRIL